MQQQQQVVEASNRDLFPEVNVFRPLETYNATPYTPPPYGASKIIRDQHGFPRFGHTNDVTALAAGSDEATDYLVGICSGALLILALALAWALALVGLRCAGHKRVGFLAGRFEPRGAGAATSPRDAGRLPRVEEDEPKLEWEDAGRPLLMGEDIEKRAALAEKSKSVVRATRIVFVLGGLGVIVASILFFVNGIKAFQDSLQSVQGGLKLVQTTAEDAIDITEGFLTDKDRLGDVFHQTTRDAGEDLCNGNSFFAQQLKKQISALSSEIEKLGAAIDNAVGSFPDDLQQVVDLAAGAESQLSNTVDIFVDFALAVIVLLDAIILAMLAVTYFSARGVANCFTKFVTHAILWPVFSFFLLLAWIFSLLFLVTSLAGADFCVQPDDVVNGFLNNQEDKFVSVIFGLVIYYTSGCEVEPAGMSNLVAIGSEIRKAVGLANTFSDTVMGRSLDRIQTDCGLDEVAATALRGGAELINEVTILLNGAFIGLRHILECKTFNSIYTTFVHDALCLDGVDGLAWIFATSFAMFVCAMIMIMFRAGLYPVKRPSTA